MSEEPPAKRIRKGTRSCQECRHRKIRCIWPSDNAQVCQSCANRNRVCELQLEVIPTVETTKLTSRARIEALEKSVSDLWNAIGQTPPVPIGQEPQSHDRPRTSHIDYQQSPDSSNPSSPANPPTHLLRLLDNDFLDSNGHETTTPTARLSTSTMSKESAALLKLLPSREDMAIIAANASDWLSWYRVLFSLNIAMSAGPAMLEDYDKVKQSATHPVPIATLLLAVTLTVQQAPDAISMLRSIPDSAAFIKDVSNLVEKVVVSNDDLIADIDGIRCALLFIRLQLGRARVRKTWLTLRRVIAVAELIGLPRAAATLSLNAEAQPRSDHLQSEQYRGDVSADQQEKAEVWESVCAIDRIISMMWSLPVATSSFPLPVRSFIDCQGEVILQAFIHRLANIASKVLELDGVYIQDKPVPDLLSAVMSTDQELQEVAKAPSKSWWIESPSVLSPAVIFQHWHSYLTIRTHLRLALAYDHDQRFLYNFIACLSACQAHTRRYIWLRPLLPAGFFANSIIDLQAFSAIVFLMLSARKSATAPSAVASRHIMTPEQTHSLIDEAVQAMERALSRTGSHSALHGLEAIKSLRSLIDQPDSAEPQRASLLLPMIGRIHVSRKSDTSRQQDQSMQSPSSRRPELPPQGGYSTNMTGSNYLSPEALNTLSYSMEVPEDYLFFTDQNFGTEQWLSWTN
ncbi:hypothetical protein KCU81_g6234, partial [Aureobasidium melanogenum]|uniref:Zn(2)-C6 fungal-type domain-containing protein n=1 Tax=Aureobasidium melanogenum (strain CBS 110374) TaxID=1043003 RepID=A0A074VEQ1_AURM1